MYGKQIVCGKVRGRNLVLKPPSLVSVQKAMGWINDMEVSKYLSHPFGIAEWSEKEWFEKSATNPGVCNWGIFYGGSHIGSTGLHALNSINHTAEYGVLIGEKQHWGKGIGTVVAKSVTAYGFQQLNLDFIYADVFLPNLGSRIALERAGYQECGRWPGRFIDGERLINWRCFQGREEWWESKKK